MAAYLGVFWSLCGSWGRLWDLFGRNLGLLGVTFWGLLRFFWLLWGALGLLWGSLGVPGSFWGRPEVDFRNLGGFSEWPFGPIFGSFLLFFRFFFGHRFLTDF